jgi:hypothetical protein
LISPGDYRFNTISDRFMVAAVPRRLHNNSICKLYWRNKTIALMFLPYHKIAKAMRKRSVLEMN